ncbi:tafazzin [Mitosporidium daphniae]|uniref:Tafazzin family protein n=1 Tax=Mitosporidium daphniae TaxID=1485682 RepID=A0A098VQ42_9MICR|nr:tafazzin [Mitosporidium daphniae]KGG50884.1 tafazzin [Mitosporidium daphniae]|eukprot:XP_013237311.1 tafazzin [Mitosporidium daphniae]
MIDDPFMWAWLPLVPLVVHPERTRWSLGAQDLLFRNAISRWFFSAGQVVPVFRAPGSFPTIAVKTAMQRLAENCWIHLFSEGHIYQNHNDAPVLPLKPGAAFLIAKHYESTGNAPIVIPMLLCAFQQFLPAHKIIPRFLSARTKLIISSPANSGITATFLRSLDRLNQRERIARISCELDRSVARIYARAMCETY